MTLSITALCHYVECRIYRYADSERVMVNVITAECRYVERHYAKCHYCLVLLLLSVIIAECHY
jgi:hypothetical protein